MRATKLTTKFIEALGEPGMYGDTTEGLRLLVSPTLTKRWVFGFRFKGSSTKTMGLGSFPAVGLASAREAAIGSRELLQTGTNPIEHRRTAATRKAGEAAVAEASAILMKKEAKRALAEARRRTMTFGMVAKELTAAKEAAWRGTKHRERWDRNFNIHAAALTDVPVDQVNLEMVLKILKPMWLTKHETATKLRSQIERTLDYAEVSGYRTGDNPARLRGRLEHVLPNASLIVKRRHHPALPFQDMPAFVKKLKAVDRVSARMIEWGIYAACRPTEARLATRDELTPDRSTWVIPEGRMKEFNEHRVPVVGPALKLIERLAEREGTRLLFVAPRGGRLSDAAAGSLLKHMGFGHITQHGFRSSFRDWVGDTRKGDRDLAEEQLAHSIGSETERAYRRGDALDLRRSLMEDWAGYCLSAV